MRNYMFDQYGMAGAPAAAAKRPRPSHSRGTMGVLGAVLFLLVIAMLTAGVVLLRRLERSVQTIPPDKGYSDSDSSFGVRPTETDGEQTETTIPRAPVGVGALMSVTGDRGAVLSGTEIYQKVLPSVVSVTAMGADSASSGSGVVLSADGYIITNYHVISGSSRAWVAPLATGVSSPAALVGYDPEMDLAVLKIDVEGLTPAEFGSSRMLEVGETAYAIGNPMGNLYGTMTSGIISAVNRPVTIAGHSMELIQTNAALNSGNSGGALINAWGQVVGITVAKIDPHGEVTTEGLGLAIPISEARRRVNTLLRCGEMENPAIGITCFNREDGSGVEVKTVNDDSPARAAGLTEKDVILAANGVRVTTVDELKDVLYDAGVGAQLCCTVMRGEETLEITFELYEM